MTSIHTNNGDAEKLVPEVDLEILALDALRKFGVVAAELGSEVDEEDCFIVEKALREVKEMHGIELREICFELLKQAEGMGCHPTDLYVHDTGWLPSTTWEDYYLEVSVSVVIWNMEKLVSDYYRI